MNSPLVSIIIPAYNHKYFREALNSALSQSYTNLEIIICDDSTKDRIEKLIPSDSRIRYYKNAKNLGVNSNFMNSFALSTGKYIKPLNDDDVLMLDCVERMLAFFKAYKENISLVFGKRDVIGVTGAKIVDYESTKRLFEVDTIIYNRYLGDLCLSRAVNYIGEPSSVMFRRADLEDNQPNILSVNGFYHSGFTDLAMWLYILKKSFASIYITKTVNYFRTHDEQYQRNPDALFNLYIAWPYIVAASKNEGYLRHPDYENEAMINVKRYIAHALEIATDEQMVELNNLAEGVFVVKEA
jgi:glycosyltransferase involved in cell wall biosynthesis